MAEEAFSVEDSLRQGLEAPFGGRPPKQNPGAPFGGFQRKQNPEGPFGGLLHNQVLLSGLAKIADHLPRIANPERMTLKDLSEETDKGPALLLEPLGEIPNSAFQLPELSRKINPFYKRGRTVVVKMGSGKIGTRARLFQNRADAETVAETNADAETDAGADKDAAGCPLALIILPY